ESGRIAPAKFFSPDGRRVMTHYGGVTRVWDAAHNSPGNLPLGKDVANAGFRLDGRRVVTVGHGFAPTWDAMPGRPLSAPVPFAYSGPVRHAEVSPDGRRMVTAGMAPETQVRDVETGRPVTPPLKHRKYLYHAGFSPDGRRVVTASADGTA